VTPGVWMALSTVAGLAFGFLAGRLTCPDDGRLNETELAKAFARERSHRERLEMPPGEAGLVHRISTDRSKFLRLRRG
jgi:hypothetical protein